MADAALDDLRGLCDQAAELASQGESGAKKLRALNEDLSRRSNAFQDLARRFYSNCDPGAADLPWMVPQPPQPELQTPMSPLLSVVLTLNLTLHTLGAAHVLAAQAEIQRPVDVAIFVETARQFMLRCDSKQVQMAPRQFFAVCQRFADECRNANRPAMAIKPLLEAGNRLSPTKSCLSPPHADALHCCLLAKRYDLAVRFLDGRPMTEVDPRRTGLTPPNLLRYLYYAGVAYVGLKRWQSAIDMFRTCLSMPANATSALAVEAYKKMVLASLISTGVAPTLPKYTPNSAARQLRINATPYSTIADRFKDGTKSVLQRAVSDNAEAILRDGNMGLAKQVVAALTRWKISELTHTYMTLSLQDIASQAGLESSAEAELHVRSMIGLGEVAASVELPSGTVTFIEEEEDCTPAMVARMESELSAVVRLAEKVRQVDANLSSHPKYLARVSDKTAMLSGAAAAIGGGDSWDEDVAMSVMADDSGGNAGGFEFIR